MAGEEDSVWRVLPGTQVHPTRRGKAWSHVPELQVTSGVPQGRACFLPAPVLTAAVTGTAGISIPGIMGGTIPGIYGYKEDKNQLLGWGYAQAEQGPERDGWGRPSHGHLLRQPRGILGSQPSLSFLQSSRRRTHMGLA